MNWLGRRIQKEINSEDTVLDLGIGDGRTTVPLKCKIQIGLDAWSDCLMKIKDIVPVFVCDLKYGMDFILEKSFDIVLLIDVLEHLEKEEALKLLEKAEKIARKKIIAFTPEGFLQQEERENNPFNIHKCEFQKREFEERGYKIEIHPGDDTHNRKYEAILAVKSYE